MKQRQFLGVGQEEAAQAEAGSPQLAVGTDVVEPSRHRAAPHVGRDRRVPPAFTPAVALGEPGQFVADAFPAAGRTPGDERHLAALVGTGVAKAVAENAHLGEAELVGEAADGVLFFVDQVAAGFGVLTVDEAVPEGPDPSADPVTCLHDGDGGAHGGEVASGHQPREAGSSHQHGGTAQAHIGRGHSLNSNGKAAHPVRFCFGPTRQEALRRRNVPQIQTGRRRRPECP